MSSGSYGNTNHGFPVESMPQSGGEAGQFETEADTTLAAGTINNYRMDHGSPVIRPVVSNPHVNGNAYANYTSMQPTSFHDSGTPSSFTGISIQDAGFPGPPVMSPLGQTPCLGPSITQSLGGFERAEFSVGAVRTSSPIYGHSLCHSEWTATPLAGSATGIQYTRADNTPNDSVSPTVSPDPFPLITAQYQKRARRDQPRKVQKKRKKIPPTPSQSSRRPAGIQSTPNGHFCTVLHCGALLTQKRGLKRHRYEVHGIRDGDAASPHWYCVPCRESWFPSRGHQWKDHLKKVHPDVNADEEYKKVEKNSRTFEPQEQISSPILEHDRRARVGPQVHPPTPPLPATAMTNPPLVSRPPSAFQQAPPDSEYHGNPVPVTHAVDPPISMYSSLAHALDDGIWTQGLAGSSPEATLPSDIDAGSALDISARTARTTLASDLT